MKKIIVLFVIHLVFFVTFSQELVQNGDMESHFSCPASSISDQLNLCIGWKSINSLLFAKGEYNDTMCYYRRNLLNTSIATKKYSGAAEIGLWFADWDNTVDLAFREGAQNILVAPMLQNISYQLKFHSKILVLGNDPAQAGGRIAVYGLRSGITPNEFTPTGLTYRHAIDFYGANNIVKLASFVIDTDSSIIDSNWGYKPYFQIVTSPVFDVGSIIFTYDYDIGSGKRSYCAIDSVSLRPINPQIPLITLTSSVATFCSTGNDTLSYNIEATNIPANSNIVIYQSTDSTFNPYLGQGDSIASIKANPNNPMDSCIRILDLFVNACLDGADNEGQNEYITVASGTGIRVSDLAIDFGSLNNAQGVTNQDINFGVTPCSFKIPQAALIANLRANIPCSNTNIIPAGPTDSIPSNAIILIFTSDDVTSTYNMSALCAKGFPIYVLQNNCRRTIDAFSNTGTGASNCVPVTNRYRHFVIRNLATGCYDSLVYDRCLPLIFPWNNTFAVNLPALDTLDMFNGGIKKGSCNGINFFSDGLYLNNLQTVKNSDTTFKFSIPSTYCNTGFHYIKAILNPAGTQPISNTIAFKLVCLDLITTVPNTSICSGDSVHVNIASTDSNATFSWTISSGTNITGASAGSGNQINQKLINTGNTKDSIVYSITATDATCTVNKQVKIYVNPSATKPNLGNDTSVCGSFSKTLITGNATTIWKKDGIQIFSGSSIDVTQTGTYTASITSSCGIVADTIIITSVINFDFGTDITTICIGGSITLDASSAYDSYLWSTGETTNIITITTPNKYWVDVFKNGCKGTDTITVIQIDKPIKPFIGNDTSFCGNFSRILTTGITQTSWTRNNIYVDSAAFVTITEDGTYIAKVSNTCGSTKDTIVITQFDLPILDIGEDATICDSVIELSVGNGNFNSILWSTNDTVASIIVSESGLYFVSVTNDNCINTDSVNITKSCDYDVYLPTAFTPNGDNINDILVPLSYIKGIEVIDFIIFDRWGEKIFEAKNFIPNDITKGWNGTYKGESCMADHYVFYYTIKLPDNKIKNYKGTIALIK